MLVCAAIPVATKVAGRYCFQTAGPLAIRLMRHAMIQNYPYYLALPVGMTPECSDLATWHVQAQRLLNQHAPERSPFTNNQCQTTLHNPFRTIIEHYPSLHPVKGRLRGLRSDNAGNLLNASPRDLNGPIHLLGHCTTGNAANEKVKTQ